MNADVYCRLRWKVLTEMRANYFRLLPCYLQGQPKSTIKISSPMKIMGNLENSFTQQVQQNICNSMNNRDIGHFDGGFRPLQAIDMLNPTEYT